MTERPNSYKIGLFVIVGIGLLIAGLFTFGARSYFQKRRTFETYVPGVVQGLSVGSPVTLRGVAVGKVTFVGFIWNEYPDIKEHYVLILFEIPEDTKLLPATTNMQEVLDGEIAHGLRARVQGQGINPASDLAMDYLDTERNPPLKFSWTPKHFYIPSAPAELAQILASIEKITRGIEKVDFAAVVARVDKVMDSADKLVTNFDQVDFRGLGTNANALLGELRDTNAKLQATLAEAQGAIKGTDLPAIGRRTEALESHLTDVAARLDGMLAGFDVGDLNETLMSVRAATGQLSDLLRELNQQPSRILFSKPALPSRSIETPPVK